MPVVPTAAKRVVKRFTPAPDQVKVWKDKRGEREVTLVRVPVSSTSDDRDDDAMRRSALDRMKASLDSGRVPKYLDHGLDEAGWHSYRVLDMVGGWVKGEIEEVDGVETLFGTAFLEPGNEDAEALARKLEKGLPVAFSVGFIPTARTPRTKDEFGPSYYDDVDLLEISAVGIPSNRDAYSPNAGLASVVAAVAKSLPPGANPAELEAALTRALAKAQSNVTIQVVKGDRTMPDEKKDKKSEPAPEGDAAAPAAAAGVTLDEIRTVVRDELKTAFDAFAKTLKAAPEPEAEPEADGKPEEAKPKRAAEPRAMVTSPDKTQGAEANKNAPAEETDGPVLGFNVARN